MALTGLIPNVIGKRRDMVPVGPIPGRTPIKVPMNTPTKQYAKLEIEKATLNPNIRCSKKPSIHRIIPLRNTALFLEENDNQAIRKK